MALGQYQSALNLKRRNSCEFSQMILGHGARLESLAAPPLPHLFHQVDEQGQSILSHVA